MTITTKQLGQICTDMEFTLSEMGFTTADVEAIVNYTEFTPIRFKVSFYCASNFHCEFFSVSNYSLASFEQVVSTIHTYIAGLETPEKLAKKEFLKQFGQIIDRARELDMPVDFINPLVTSMEKLSSNILEDHS